MKFERSCVGYPPKPNIRMTSPVAGFNQVDLRHDSALGIKVAHVPAYSPYAVAEFALTLVMALNRRIHRAYNGCATVISRSTVFLALTSRKDSRNHWHRKNRPRPDWAVLGLRRENSRHDLHPNPAFTKPEESMLSWRLFSESDIISLHCPLTPKRYHLIGGRPSC